MRPSVIVVGAGVGGLAASIELAKRGASVTVLERAPRVGGKLRAVTLGGQRLDAGPTVLTFIEIFEALFAGTGRAFHDAVPLRQAEILARHVFHDGSALDLFADVDRSAAAIATLAGEREAEGYRAFSRFAAQVFETVREPFIMSPRPGALALLRQGPTALARLARIAPHQPLMTALERFFRDPRLLQLFGRYATYVGSSPYAAPATLAVIAHVERTGVWLAEGGLYTLGEALAALAVELGVRIRCGAEVLQVEAPSRRVRGVQLAGGERLEADSVVLNVDAGALAQGLLGDEVRLGEVPPVRSLSAVTWHAVARCRGLPLSRHNVLFSADYRREFADLFEARALPADPTLYVCAQDRRDAAVAPDGRERLLILANAPAAPVDEPALDALTGRMLERLTRAGVDVSEAAWSITTPDDFARRFPGSGGALYGAAQHHWSSFFSRPGARTRVRGLYLAGGSAHPGPGVPMAAQSGRLAAAAVAHDLGLAA